VGSIKLQIDIYLHQSNYSNIKSPRERMIATQEKVQLKVVPESAENVLKVNYHNLKKAALVLRALNHKLRQQILTLIETEDKITVTEIYVRMRLEQSVASQHLAILRRAGIVSTQRDGKFIYYTVNYKRIDQITGVTESLVA
jgi:DNA-binding transcriptional ArsR family regulator